MNSSNQAGRQGRKQRQSGKTHSPPPSPSSSSFPSAAAECSLRLPVAEMAASAPPPATSMAEAPPLQAYHQSHVTRSVTFSSDHVMQSVTGHVRRSVTRRSPSVQNQVRSPLKTFRLGPSVPACGSQTSASSRLHRITHSREVGIVALRICSRLLHSAVPSSLSGANTAANTAAIVPSCWKKKSTCLHMPMCAIVCIFVFTSGGRYRWRKV